MAASSCSVSILASSARQRVDPGYQRLTHGRGRERWMEVIPTKFMQSLPSRAKASIICRATLNCCLTTNGKEQRYDNRSRNVS
jgi:hypothetical protein